LKKKDINQILNEDIKNIDNYSEIDIELINKKINILNNINAYEWSGNLFVGVGGGSSNVIVTSTDAISWTDRTSLNLSVFNNNWTSLTWSSELNLYCAVSSTGTGNRIMTSSDGITWTRRISPADNNWEKVIWVSELSLFVAVASSGNNNRIMTSPDGITWTTRNTNYNDFGWNSVIWNSNISKFIIFSSNESDNVIGFSANGIQWELIYHPRDNSYKWYSSGWNSTYNKLQIMGVNTIDQLHILEEKFLQSNLK
jgi:hypothetical protein